jgi:hypothetical protein
VNFVRANRLYVQGVKKNATSEFPKKSTLQSYAPAGPGNLNRIANRLYISLHLTSPLII